MNNFATLSEIRNGYTLADIFDANEVLSIKIQLENAAVKTK
jgi:hypothetical protein